MIPETLYITMETKQKPSLSFKIDFDRNKIIGKTDELEAVRQAAFLMLSTERDYSPIYEDYGIKYDDLIGKDKYFVLSELKRRITESLKEDDRIIEVDNFEFNEINDGLETTFDVISIYGSFASKGVFNI